MMKKVFNKSAFKRSRTFFNFNNDNEVDLDQDLM